MTPFSRCMAGTSPKRTILLMRVICAAERMNARVKFVETAMIRLRHYLFDN